MKLNEYRMRRLKRKIARTGLSATETVLNILIGVAGFMSIVYLCCIGSRPAEAIVKGLFACGATALAAGVLIEIIKEIR